MTSKPTNKKPVSKKSPAKKGSTKKKPASGTPKEKKQTEAQVKLEKVATSSSPSADFFLKASTLDALVVKVNDVQSPSLRKRMLAWFANKK